MELEKWRYEYMLLGSTHYMFWSMMKTLRDKFNVEKISTGWTDTAK